jgi:(3S)-malyl-CoA thioesterase
MTHRPYRSALYLPGSNDRALDKARTLAVDAILFDLEDAVAVDQKAAARDGLAAALIQGGYGGRARIVRINGFDTEWADDDLTAIAAAKPDGILLPKVDSVADIETLDAKMSVLSGYGDTRIWAMIETPLGVLNAAQIAAHPRMEGFVLGTNDLAKDLNTRSGVARWPLMTSLQLSLLAARAHGLVALDGVYNAFKDEDGLRAECEQGRDMGFDGKTLIHPAQVAVANVAFAPSEQEVDLAHRQIEAFEAAEAEGKGVAVVDGRIVENLHIVSARATLAKMKMIATLES